MLDTCLTRLLCAVWAQTLQQFPPPNSPLSTPVITGSQLGYLGCWIPELSQGVHELPQPSPYPTVAFCYLFLLFGSGGWFPNCLKKVSEKKWLERLRWERKAVDTEGTVLAKPSGE